MLKKHFKKIMAIGIFVILSHVVFGQVTFETKVTSY